MICSRPIIHLLKSGLFVGLLGLSNKAFAQTDTKDFDAAFQELKRNDNLQFEMPAPPPPIEVDEPSETPAWLEAIIDFIVDIFSFLAPFLKYAFYGLLILGVGTILYFILREFIQMRFPQKVVQAETEKVPDIPLYAPTHDEARVLLETVDALAADGKFDEAVHTLLFRSIQDIDLKRPNIIRRSLTSREISNLSILTPLAQQTFGLIANVVEESFFGGQGLGKSDYETCREAYVQFTQPDTWTV